MNPIMVRILLGVYLLLCLGVFGLLWRNAASERANEILGVLFASLPPAFIAVLFALKQETIERRFTYVLFYDSVGKSVTTGSIPNAYDSSYFTAFTNVDKAPTALAFTNPQEALFGDKGLDLIEKATVETLLMHFSRQWDFEIHEYRTPAGTGQSWGGPPTDSKTVTLQELRKHFPRNPLVTTEGVIPYPTLCLPPGTRMSTERGNRLRRVRFVNPFAKIELTIQTQGGVVLQRGVWGVVSPDPKNMNRYFEFWYPVTLRTEFSWWRHGDPAMAAYRRWSRNIGNILSRMDWGEIEFAIRKEREQGHIGN